jgi:uncharacterized SAM-binding protein YcdF (DUF218 family)
MYHRSTAPPRMIVLGVEVEVRTIGKILEGAGIRPELVVLEPAAPNTMAAAERLSEIAKEQQIGSLMTITSALHVRRSNLSLAKAGVSSCLTGVDHQYQDDQFTRFLPRPIEFTRADKLLHEVFGIIWYQFAK